MSHSTPRFLDEQELTRLWRHTLGAAPDLASCPADRSYRPPDRDASAESPQAESPSGFVRCEIMARGGNGRVYRAQQLDLQREVALKTIQYGAFDPRVRRSFLSEAITTGRLEHPNIVPVHSLGTTAEGELFLAMKLIDGENWADQLQRGEASLEDQLGILIQVCNAVAFAHSRLIVHNDLKPENVMLGRFGEVLVVDWGSAVYVGDRRDNEALRHKSQISSPCGTPCCMAPEQALGHGDALGPATDVFLLGATLHVILTGRQLHQGKNLLEVGGRLTCRALPEFGADVPEDLQAICREAVQFTTAERPTVAVFQARLRDFLTHRQSRRISRQARQILDQIAREAPSHEPVPEARQRPYERYSAAITGFGNARQLWRGNPEAVVGEREARITYARSALEFGDVGLAESQIAHIDGDPDAKAALVAAIAGCKQQRLSELKARRRQRRLLVLASLVLGVCLPLVLLLLSQTRHLRREREATDFERRGLARQHSPQGRLLLERAVALDPTRSAAWRALGRIYVRAGKPEDALVCCEQALKLAANDPTLTAIRGEALELLGDEQAALGEYLRAFGLGERSEQLSLRLSRLLVGRSRFDEALPLLNVVLEQRSTDSLALRLRSTCYAGLGSTASAEEDRWKLLLQDPVSDRLVALVQARIEQDDLEGLPRMWQEIYRRLAGDAGLFRISVQAYDRLLGECTDVSLAATRRVASCLALSLFARNGSRQSLRRVATLDRNPLIAEAARSSLLILQAERGLHWWTAELLGSVDAQQEQRRTGGAAAVLSLLENAPSLNDSDFDDLMQLTRAEGWLLRAALPLTVALASSGSDGLGYQNAQRVLTALGADPYPLVRRKAGLWKEALKIFEHPEDAEILTPAAIGLAVRLCLRAGERTATRRQAVFRLLDRALETMVHADLLYLRATLRLEAGDPEGGEADLLGAIDCDPGHRAASQLILQLRLVGDRDLEPPTDTWQRDPAAVAGLVRRATFMRRSGMVVLPGPNGTVRASVYLAGGRASKEVPGFDVSTVGATMTREGLQSSGPTRLLSKFAASEWYSVEVSGPDRGALVLDTDRHTRWGLVCGFHAGATYCKIDAGEQIYHKLWSEPVRVQNAVIRRDGLRLLYDGRLGLEHPVSARTFQTQGLFKMIYGYGGFEVQEVLQHWKGVFRLLDIETRPPLPPASPVAELSPSAPLRGYNLPSPHGQEWASLRDGVDLPLAGRWIADSETAPMLLVEDLRGDLVVQAHVEFGSHSLDLDLGAGVAFRSARGLPQAVRLFLSGPTESSPYPASVQLATQMGTEWEFPVVQLPWQDPTGVELQLRRQGDYILAFCAGRGRPLEPLGDPVYFPLDEPVEAGIFARTNGVGEGTVHFEEISILTELD